MALMAIKDYKEQTISIIEIPNSVFKSDDPRFTNRERAISVEIMPGFQHYVAAVPHRRLDSGL